MTLIVPNAANARLALRYGRRGAARIGAIRSRVSATLSVNALGEITFSDTGTDLTFTTTDPAWPGTYTITAAQLAALQAGAIVFVAFAGVTGLSTPPVAGETATASAPLIVWRASDGEPELTNRWLTDDGTDLTYTLVEADLIAGVQIRWTAVNQSGSFSEDEDTLAALQFTEQRITGGSMFLDGHGIDSNVTPIPTAFVMESYIYQGDTDVGGIQSDGSFATEMITSNTWIRPATFYARTDRTAGSGVAVYGQENDWVPPPNGTRVDVLAALELPSAGDGGTVLGGTDSYRACYRLDGGPWVEFSTSYLKGSVTYQSIVFDPAEQFRFGSYYLDANRRYNNEAIRSAFWANAVVDPFNADVRNAFFDSVTGQVRPIAVANALLGVDPLVVIDNADDMNAGTPAGTLGGTWTVSAPFENLLSTPFVEQNGASYLSAPAEAAITNDWMTGLLFMSFNAPGTGLVEFFGPVGSKQRPFNFFLWDGQATRLYGYTNTTGTGGGLNTLLFRTDTAPFNGLGFSNSFRDKDVNLLVKFDHTNGWRVAIQATDGSWLWLDQDSTPTGTIYRGGEPQIFSSTADHGGRLRRAAWWTGIAPDVSSVAIQDLFTNADLTLRPSAEARASLGTPVFDFSGPASRWDAGEHDGSVSAFTPTGSFVAS